jgi:hypothetical protein
MRHPAAEARREALGLRTGSSPSLPKFLDKEADTVIQSAQSSKQFEYMATLVQNCDLLSLAYDLHAPL